MGVIWDPCFARVVALLQVASLSLSGNSPDEITSPERPLEESA